MIKLFTLLGLAFCWLPLQAQRLSPAQPPAAPYVLRPTSPPVKTAALEAWFPQVRQLEGGRGPGGIPALRLGGKGILTSLSSVAIPVEAGQLVEVQFWARAQKPAPWLSKRLPLAIGAAALSSQVSLPRRGEGGSAQAQSLTLPLLTAGAVLALPLVKSLAGGKKAYARLHLYDGQGRLVQESTQSLSKQARKGGELISLRLEASQKGYAQLQLVNNRSQEVYFEEGQMASPAWLDFGRPDTPSNGPQPDSAQSLSVRKPLPIDNDGNGGGNNGGGGSPFNTGKGTESDPYVLPTLTVRATVPANRYQELANGLFYVQPGTYSNFYFPVGYYRAPQGGGGGGGGGGSSPGDNAPPPLPNTVENATLPVSPHDGQVFTYLDSQGKLVTLVYNKALNSWVLPGVTVKGTPPANPAVNTYYYYQDLVTQKREVYVWTGTRWVTPVAKATSLFPSKNVIDFTKNPCIKDILTKLFATKSNIFSDILNKTFGNNSDAELDIRFAENTLTGTTDGKTSGTQYSYDMYLNEVMMARNSSKQYITATIIHELLHAYMDYETRVKKNPTFLNKDESQQHEYMAANYVDDMRDIITALYPDFSVNEAEALAWGGLEGTAAYQTQVVAAGKETFKNEVNLREKNVTGTNNWRGKPCDK